MRQRKVHTSQRARYNLTLLIAIVYGTFWPALVAAEPLAAAALEPAAASAQSDPADVAAAPLVEQTSTDAPAPSAPVVEAATDTGATPAELPGSTEPAAQAASPATSTPSPAADLGHRQPNDVPTAEPAFNVRFPERPARIDQGAATPRRSKVQPPLRTFGAMLDVGLPDGLIAGIACRPWDWLRIQAGAGTNGVSPGIRGGVALVPLSLGPSLTVEAGQYFEGDANGVAAQVVGPGYQNSEVAKRVGYKFANAHLGLELGREYFTFFLHGGASYIRTNVHNADDVLGGQVTNAQGDITAVRVHGDPTIAVWVPSFKLGFVIYIV